MFSPVNPKLFQTLTEEEMNRCLINEMLRVFLKSLRGRPFTKYGSHVHQLHRDETQATRGLPASPGQDDKEA